MKIQFNQSLDADLFKAEDITPSIIEIALQPHEDNEVDVEKLKFAWEVTDVNYDIGFIDI